MDTATRKEVLTTGEVARICHVAPRTVSKWFDTGKLRGYRIPGSRDRRIPVDQLVAFMRAHSMPLDGLGGGPSRVLIIDANIPAELTDALAQTDRYEVRTARGGFDGGVIAQRMRPDVIVIDASLDGDEAAAICRNVRQHPELQAARVLAAVEDLDEPTRRKMAAAGFDDCLAKPYSLRELVRAVEDATNIIG
jgi:excisionase family DNA binding protein